MGVRAPPILATKNIKKTTVCTVCCRHLFARKIGRIRSMEAPVVPIQDASTVPINIKRVFIWGVPDNRPLILIPPDIV